MFIQRMKRIKAFLQSKNKLMLNNTGTNVKLESLCVIIFSSHTGTVTSTVNLLKSSNRDPVKKSGFGSDQKETEATGSIYD